MCVVSAEDLQSYLLLSKFLAKMFCPSTLEVLKNWRSHLSNWILPMTSKFLEQLGQFHALSALNWWINSYWMPVTYILGQGTEGKVSKCSSKFSGFTCAVKVVPSDLMIRTKHSEPRFFICLALFCIIQFVVEVEWLLTFYYMHHMQWCYADGKAKPS